MTADNERYRFLRTIGSGGFGTVWQARDVFLEEDCAVKVLHESSGDLGALLHEPRLLNKLKHPNIVALRDIELIDGKLSIVMEYVGGGSLRSRLGRPNQGRPFPLAFSLRIAGEVLTALSAAHAIGVLHRDIKPDNVLLTEDGRVKVTDFGIARLVDGLASYTMNPGGTILYMSPEALRGECSPAVDFWATAVMLYEMMTGLLPFPGPSTGEVVHQIETGRFRPILEANPTAGADAAALVERALAPERDRRFPTAEAFLEALDRLSGIGPDAGVATPDPGQVPIRHIADATPALDQALAAIGARIEAGDLAGAASDLHRQLGRTPGHARLHFLLGEVLRKQQNEIDAFGEYERAFVLAPDDLRSAAMLAELGVRVHRPVRCVEALELLLKHEPQSAIHHRRLALALAQLGERERAVAALRRALELDPSHKRSRRILERWLRGEFESAEE